MSIKIFGLLITDNALLKAIESGEISAVEAAVSALATSSDPNAASVASAVRAKITELSADDTSTGVQKLEKAALFAVQILAQFGFTATKDFGIALVQTLYNSTVGELESIGHEILVKLGLAKA